MRVRPIIVSAFLAVFASLALAGPSSASREFVVYLTKAGFSPKSSSIAVGDRIRFTVRDHKAHQVAKASGPTSGEIPPTVLDNHNNSLTVFPAEAGTYAYIDRLNAARPQYQLTVRR
ncbi:MAG TPA: cupredoxin domain-containing protein [Candidatus Elarobacter sp.]|jgi:plastocyanin|nr:cupredoxin domain-containing protein [Candidatus Elarobacter sp.]